MNEFWDRNSGITTTPQETARAAAANSAAQTQMDASALTPTEVAQRLNLSLPAVQRYTTEKKLYAYRLDDGDLVLPIWQFNSARNMALPSLGDVLASLPDDLHPLSVAGFFLTHQPDLVLDRRPVSAKAWLEAGGSSGVVIDLAKGLTTGY